MEKLTDEDKKKLSRLIHDKPPKIGLVGVSGVGKSSTINAMFKTCLPISHTKACTTEFREVPLELTFNQGPAVGQNINLVVCDAPGLGEDIRKDPEYIDMYRNNLPSCDIILWIMSARNRAVALDQIYLNDFMDLSERIVFGLNQVDLVEPMNWNSSLPIPSEDQLKHIVEIVSDRQKRLSDTIGRNIDIIPYSNYRRYNLEVLFAKLLHSCSGNRSWIFGGLKNFNFEDELSVKLLEELTKRNIDSSRADMREKYNRRPSQDKSQRNPDHNQSYGKPASNWLPILSSQFKGAFQRIFGSDELDPRLRATICRAIGRDNIDQIPLNEDELSIVESIISQEKRRAIGD